MQRLSTVILALLLIVGAQTALAQPLPECYHTRQELYDYIFDLQAEYPDTVRVDSIGHSRGDQLGVQYPIYAVKISNHANEFEDEPVILIIAHIHAEEVAGLEATLEFMRLVARGQGSIYRTLRDRTQLYVIPTMNPDGLEVISLGWDRTFRKNGYIPPELLPASCNIDTSLGGDSCGVDLNRNFELNWIYGDTLWVRGSEEPFDYYRGPSPFSEPETRAVRDFSLEIKPTVSIVWHSSRSGRVAERCITAWQWGPDGAAKYAPDSAAISDVDSGYVLKTRKYPSTGSTNYMKVWGGTRNGDLQDWFYRELGAIQILTETSPPELIQPTCATNVDPNLPELIETLLPPMQWLCRRVLNYDVSGDMSSPEQGAPLYIYTRNAQTSQAISAEYRVLNTWTPLLSPWYTHEAWGRATFLPTPGQVTVMARKEGFRNDTVTVTSNPSGSAVEVLLELEPLPWHNVTINVRNESNELVPARIHFDNGFPQTYDFTSGTLELSKPELACNLRIEPLEQNNLITRWIHFWHDQDTVINVVLPNGTPLFTDNFEDDLNGWSAVGGQWRGETDTMSLGYGRVIHTNDSTYRHQYGPNWDATLTYDGEINLTGGNAFHLKFDRRGRLDMPADSFLVEVSPNQGTDWQQAAGYSDLQVPWTRTIVDLSHWAGNSIRLRFRMKTDALLGDLGIYFDNIVVLGGLDTSAPEQPLPLPREFKMTKVYPNPFNPTTTIAYEAASSGPLNFTIHNLLGQLVWSSTETPPGPGRYELRWNGTNNANQLLPSGIYFVRMSAKSNFYGTQKLMFLK